MIVNNILYKLQFLLLEYKMSYRYMVCISVYLCNCIIILFKVFLYTQNYYNKFEK